MSLQPVYYGRMPAKSTTAAAPGPPIKTLVIDDDPAHGETIADSLATLGYGCRVATNGEEGAALLEKEPFEIVITDLRMNGTRIWNGLNGHVPWKHRNSQALA